MDLVETIKIKTMEEKKQKEEQKKLSYEELEKIASDLHVQYQKLMAEYQKCLNALNSRDFEYTSFFLGSLFRVMDHPEMYKDEFVKWASENIEAALTAFAEDAQKSAEAERKKNAGK